jgi:hypothetical protein
MAEKSRALLRCVNMPTQPPPKALAFRLVDSLTPIGINTHSAQVNITWATAVYSVLLGIVAVLLGAPLSQATLLWWLAQCSLSVLPFVVASLCGRGSGGGGSATRGGGKQPEDAANTAQRSDDDSSAPSPSSKSSPTFFPIIETLLREDLFWSPSCRPLTVPSFASLAGAWVGAIVGPLDWDTEWQVWPIASTYTALMGLVIGHVVVVCMRCAVGGGIDEDEDEGDGAKGLD